MNFFKVIVTCCNVAVCDDMKRSHSWPISPVAVGLCSSSAVLTCGHIQHSTPYQRGILKENLCQLSGLFALTFCLELSYNSLRISSDLGWVQRFLARSAQTWPTCVGQRTDKTIEACGEEGAWLWSSQHSLPYIYLLSPINRTIGTPIFLAVSY